jgi:hypothetical protein
MFHSPTGQRIAAFFSTSLSSRSSRTSLRRRVFYFSTSSCGPDIRSSCSLSGYCCAIPCRAVDVVEPTYSASRRQPPNPRKAAGALSRWSSPSALHHLETRLCTSLPFHISFIANIARKRPELKQGKTKTGHRRGDAMGLRPAARRAHKDLVS